MATSLVIVESPTKARTIARFLGNDFVVEASIGAIRDLEPKGLAVDIDADFKPTYVVPPAKKDVVRRLRAALQRADRVFLATDEDREGEAIAWHLTEVLRPRVPTRRMVFHEITRQAIDHAVENSRDIDQGLVDAQETRRIIDRLFGYPVSEVLWRKISTGLSAGRVQSPAVRLVVERERERMDFVAADYWDLRATFPTEPTFAAVLVGLDDVRVATGRDFDGHGRLRRAVGDGNGSSSEGRGGHASSSEGRGGDPSRSEGRGGNGAGGRSRANDLVVLDEASAGALVRALHGAPFTVSSVEEKPYRSSPKAPFITSTLQQEGGRKLGMGARQVMRTAQGLYERGYISYMRTDSTTLSDEALRAARAQVRHRYGEQFLPDQPRVYRSKVKNAQEAHEAIRPAGEHWRTPDQLATELRGADLRLYDLIWKRTLASQMVDASGKTVAVRIEAPLDASVRADAVRTDGDATGGGRVAVGEFRRTEWAAAGRTIEFPGYLRVYVEGSDDPEADLDDRERVLPTLVAGQRLPTPTLEPVGHTTQPPARYTEASLVKKLEELGIGRPSTYVSITQTIQDRGYVWKKGQALVPSWTAFAVVNLLEGHFSAEVDYSFTARMEDDLDEIAVGERERVPFLREFWFGSDRGNGGAALAERAGSDSDAIPGLTTLIDLAMTNADPAAVNAIPLGKDDDGNEIVVRNGRYGPYLRRGDDTVSLPADLAPDELSIERALEMLAAPRGTEPIGTDPTTGLPVFVKSGRFGPYVQLGDAQTLPAGAKPRMASLLKTMSPSNLGLDEALQLLSLPRVVGVDPATGEEITAQNGRYGPYLRKGGESRSLGSEDQLFTVGLDEALRLFAEPKRRGREATAATTPLRELGQDPVSGRPVALRSGRYGPYVTDGETNASLREREGDTVEGITLERAVGLLKARREAGPSKRSRAPRAKKATAKKATAKKATAKKATAKKATAKKAAAKNATAKREQATRKATANAPTTRRSSAGRTRSGGDEPRGNPTSTDDQ